MYPPRNPIGPLLTLLALLALSGCLRLEKPYPQRSSYALEVSRDAPGQQLEPNRVLQIRKFTSAPSYRGKGFVYRTGELTYQTDYYHRFFTPPAAMVTEQSRRWLQQGGLFGRIDQGGYPLTTDLLQGRIGALYGDYRPGREPTAILELHLTLIDQSRTKRPVLDRLYRRRLPLADREPATLVQAWNEALTDILAEFEGQLRQNRTPANRQAF